MGLWYIIVVDYVALVSTSTLPMMTQVLRHVRMIDGFKSEIVSHAFDLREKGYKKVIFYQVSLIFNA